MTDGSDEAVALGVGCLSVVAGCGVLVGFLAWFVVLPTVGLLYMIGYLR